MAEPLIRTYVDPYGKPQQGYLIDNKTYTDPNGVNRVEIGSQIMADDGTWYKLTENGGVKTTGYQEPVSQGSATGQVQTAVLPQPGDYYAPPKLPSATSAEKYIKDLYEAQRTATLQDYKTAYDANINDLNAAAAKIPAQYQTARNQAAAQSEIERANFNEYAAAHGLNSGTGGQAMLAMSGQLQGNLSGIGAAEADALSDLELQRTQLATQFQNDITQAINTGRLEEAYALYGEYIRVDDSIVNTAMTQAGLNADAFGMNNNIYNMNKSDALTLAQYTGDYSGLAIYGWTPQQIAAANQQWLDDKNAYSGFLD